MGSKPYKGVMRKYHSLFSLGQRVFDAGLVFVLLYLICISYNLKFGREYMLLGIFAIALTWIVMGVVDAYRPWRGASLWREFQVLLLGWLLVALALLVLAWATKSSEMFSRVVLGLWFVITPLAFVLVRLLQRLFLRMLRKQGHNKRRVVVVGAGALGQQLADKMQQADWMGVTIVGFFDDDTRKQGKDILGIPVLGKAEAVHDFVNRENIDQVYLALPMRSEKRMREVFDDLQDTTASIYLVPDLFIFELMGAREHEVAGMPAFALCETPLTGPFGSIKRIEDIVLATLSLMTFFPLMIVIAVLIKTTSKGPVLFKQTRYGLNGEKIKVYKFRSMTVCENDDTVIQQASRYDIRVTRLGLFLRRTSLDELPQFINVLQGRMSVVGPRPHAVAHNEQYRKLIKGYMWRHKVKPGITGWAQINGWRGETDTIDKMKKRVEYDLEYIQHWSLWLDLKIFFFTMFKGFKSKNAY